MLPVIAALLPFLGSLYRFRGSLTLHVLALQHQVAVYKQTVHHPRLRPSDRLSGLAIASVARLASHPSVCPATHGDRVAARSDFAIIGGA